MKYMNVWVDVSKQYIYEMDLCTQSLSASECKMEVMSCDIWHKLFYIKADKQCYTADFII